MAQADPIAELDRLLVEDPCRPDVGEAMSVAGDLLQHKGQLRGELIALELMLAAAPASERKQVADTLESFVAGHDARMFGSIHALRHRRGALRYSFHGGRIDELFLDARRLGWDPRLTLGPDEIVQLLLGSPAIEHAQRLQIRVGKSDALVRFLAELRKQAGGKLANLEQLILSTTTRPLGHRAHATATELAALRKAAPKLWLATESGYLVSLIDPKIPDEASASDLHGMRGHPMTRELRVLIGRGLTSGRSETTKVACERIAEHGESARVFLPALRMLLRPQVSHAAAWIVPMIPHFDGWARELVPTLRRITGSSKAHALELRRAAGLALHRLGPEPTPVE
ncbi:hypothetical protein ACNOYE_18885 [Nannocystaceae bacterium ST9]